MRYQTLFKQYVWLVNIIARYGRICLDEINERWIETDMSEGMPMARSTFNRHKDAIEDIFGIYIECDRKNGYKYYIGNAEDLESDSIQKWMLSTMTVNNLLVDNKSIHNRVLLESVPSSEPYLSDLMYAMKHNIKVKIGYQKYSSSPSPDRIVEPFCVKLYRRRWYVLGRIENGELRSFSLDRIHMLELTQEHFEMPDDFDAERYFRDVVGIMQDPDYKMEHIVVRAYKYEKYYLRDLPLHSSQKEIADTEEYADFEYNLIPSADFFGQILSRGGNCKILEPQWLADEIKESFEYALNVYKAL